MNIIEDIKAYFKKLGLNWNGFIYKNKVEGWVEANEEDFDQLKTHSFNLDFRNGGMCGLIAEIDAVTFKIYGEDFNSPLFSTNPDFEKNIKVINELDDKDFSKEFAQFQLARHGLCYAVLIRNKCQEKRNKVQDEAGKRVKQLTKKINYLERTIQKVEDEASDRIEEIDNIESLAIDYKK